MKKRKICVITGSRAEYGLLYWLLKSLQKDESVELQICVTGMHLSEKHGLTYRQIEEDGFNIDRKVDSNLSSDTATDVAKSTGWSMIGFADAFQNLGCDVVVVVGDRFEIFGAVAAANIANIPVAHCHGGELTLGAFDDSLRHSITKMSHLHFCATEEYKRRIIQLGEDPTHVYLVGALGIENTKRLTLIDKTSLEERLNFKFGQKNLMVTFHPVTRETRDTEIQFRTLVKALDELNHVHLIFTRPNADTGGQIINEIIDDYLESRGNSAVAFTSMGHLNYLSAFQYVNGVVGNSSSGIIEAPSFGIGTVNIGSRQEGRVKGPSVIDCKPDSASLKSALEKLLSRQFLEEAKSAVNPYDYGNASGKIIEVIRNADLSSFSHKRFFDI